MKPEMQNGSSVDPYLDFLASKVILAPERGMPADAGDMHPRLKPHQRDIAAWCIRGGARAIFASFGLGKTLMQVQILVWIVARCLGSGLIVCPLGVRGEFVRDALEFFGVVFHYIRTNEEHEQHLAQGHKLFLTNYERVRDGDIDPNRFAVVSLDEASVLRSFGSKTYQTFLTLFDRVPYKFVATATPSPNRLKELIHYAAFLGVMDSGQALTRFFKRDSTKAGNLTIHPHKEREFWLWVSSWATFITKPSDLGYDDTGYDLPPMRIHRHRLQVDHSTAGFDSWGQGKLIRDATAGLSAAAREKRESLADRVRKAKEIIDAGAPDQHWIIWHDLEDEREAVEKAFVGYDLRSVRGSQNAKELEHRERDIVEFGDGKYRILSTKPIIAGSGCNFQRHCYSAIYLGLTYKFNDFIQAAHRIYRFLQTHDVDLHLIHTESEDPVYDELMRKWKEHDRTVAEMTAIIHRFGLNNARLGAEMQRSIGIERREARSTYEYRA